MYTVYILFSESINNYYVGYTNDIDRRLGEHNRKKGKYTDREMADCNKLNESLYIKKSPVDFHRAFLLCISII